VSTFADQVKSDQIAWRAAFLQEMSEYGRHQGKRYAHVLPPQDWEKNLWPGIRSDSPDSLESYIRANAIWAHTGKHHLNSSWVLCANLYFPFRRTERARQLVAGFLRNQVHKDIVAVCRIELEFQFPPGDALHPGNLLGEKEGGRGKGQTSPDVAFIVKTASDADGLVLTESKYAEHSFYECSAYRAKQKPGRTPNPDRKRCEDVKSLLKNPRAQCHQFAWGRKYWDQLAVDEPTILNLPCCPAAKGGYQLLRQQALAEGIARSGRYSLVISCVAYDPRNTALLQSLKRAGITNWTDGWGRLFNGKACFRSFTHQAWVAWVRDHDGGGEWQDWLCYIQSRYGYGEKQA
jgi:hypothetical protein